MRELYKIEPILPKKRYSIRSSIRVEREIDNLREEIYTELKNLKGSKSAIGNFAPVDINEFSRKSLFNKKSLKEHRFYKKYVIEHPDIEDKFLRLKEFIKEWIGITEKDNFILSI